MKNANAFFDFAIKKISGGILNPDLLIFYFGKIKLFRDQLGSKLKRNLNFKVRGNQFNFSFFFKLDFLIFSFLFSRKGFMLGQRGKGEGIF